MASMLEYLLERQPSSQWRGILTALAQEFEAQLGVEELRELMRRVGYRFGAAYPLPPCESIEQLTDALNLRWGEHDWGYVELQEDPDYLGIVHHCAPLRAFGAQALTWTPALLEGAYQFWLGSLGAGPLQVKQHAISEHYASVEFRLER
jgi:hypothetical protein